MEYQNGPSIIQVIKQNIAEKQAGKSEMYIFWTLSTLRSLPWGRKLRSYNDILQRIHNITHLVKLGKGHGMHDIETLPDLETELLGQRNAQSCMQNSALSPRAIHDVASSKAQAYSKLHQPMSHNGNLHQLAKSCSWSYLSPE
ncbi:unnamed protein product [Sphenostylis stenocarpa]|uniref:Uncharacterized protein n=1 Tax=Sphenostylis stenocarpa TaxID=92480 RepID=A0AA86SEJ9_9FABA|nr:unnamed protein product [Sphenostylis stenocarpa]